MSTRRIGNGSGNHTRVIVGAQQTLPHTLFKERARVCQVVLGTRHTSGFHPKKRIPKTWLRKKLISQRKIYWPLNHWYRYEMLSVVYRFIYQSRCVSRESEFQHCRTNRLGGQIPAATNLCSSPFHTTPIPTFPHTWSFSNSGPDLHSPLPPLLSFGRSKHRSCCDQVYRVVNYGDEAHGDPVQLLLLLCREHHRRRCLFFWWDKRERELSSTF